MVKQITKFCFTYTSERGSVQKAFSDVVDEINLGWSELMVDFLLASLSRLDRELQFL